MSPLLQCIEMFEFFDDVIASHCIIRACPPVLFQMAHSSVPASPGTPVKMDDQSILRFFTKMRQEEPE